MGDGRAEGSSPIGDRGPAAAFLMSLMLMEPDACSHLESSQLEGSREGDLLYWILTLSASKRL